MAMSAANAVDDSKAAAPAATRNLTLRIGFVLLSGEADNGGLTFQKLTAGRCHQMFKRHLTLILKVDNPLRAKACRHRARPIIANNVLIKFRKDDAADRQRAARGIFGRNTASSPITGSNAQT